MSTGVRVVGGADEDLIRCLYAEHGGALFAFCVRFTGDAQQAEDAVQEVLLRAWRSAGTVDLTGRPARPWLFAVARNVLTDVHRAARSRPEVVTDDSSLGTLPAPDEVDRAVESWTMAEALRSLSAEHRAVLVQSYWLGRSVAETARHLGIPPGTVKSRTYYALRGLRLALEEMGVGS
ncbi:RNA polymerase sigma-70 factor, ECF subfamily [Modestobacter sp. DSM 44400]|uniref:sigma-70 family RNA polymerase sigma factor n=1 Tax=Modestobacter sp. DSM 44400 TaxID=1550230 RepID=UPI00089CF4BA|nr:sigma-70 family RNA polymerase sigma factor [Modestobacter sp. DSM 44400]SDY28458.1 RNA polymerase sigma-70 factor, ECF subfamily [Modestobacter sp. DSM 44400]